MLSTDDRLAIQELISLYGHIIDDRKYSRTHELFTEDAVYDVSDFDAGVHIGWQRIAQFWRDAEAGHPLAHHSTNVIVTQDGDGTVRAVSKGIGIRADAAATTTIYRDIAVRTRAGWRLSERVAVRRSADRIPPHS
jgi:hypothetical protein